jgi:hypothetical protein
MFLQPEDSRCSIGCGIIDALCFCLGEFKELSSVVANQRKQIRIVETGGRSIRPRETKRGHDGSRVLYRVEQVYSNSGSIPGSRAIPPYKLKPRPSQSRNTSSRSNSGKVPALAAQ